jgi:cytoskeleton protein RodZ
LEPTAQPSASEASGAQAASAAATASAPAPAAVQAQAAAPTQAETAAQGASAAASGAQAAVASGAATIAVKVSQDSWFSVRDKNGKEVFSGLVHAGDTKEISGVPPLKVVAGNRAGLESMTLDGQPVDAAKFGPNKGNVVRFTLP